MQKIKLQQWLLAGSVLLVFASCSRNNYPQRQPRNDRQEDMYPGTEAMPPGQAKKVYGEQSARVFAPGQRKKMRRSGNYRPAPVIIISDHQARSNRNGELYYDDAYGYRYWRNCDGKYYLDSKYEVEDYNDNRGKYKKGKHKKQKKYEEDEDDDDK